MLGTEIFQGVLEVQDGARVGARDAARLLSILVPRAALVSPDGALQEFLRVGIEVGDAFSFRGNRSIAVSC